MSLESIIEREVYQKEKNKYYILMHIYEIQQDGIDAPICRAAMETQIQRTDLWIWAGEDNGMKRGSGMETYILPV